MKAPVGAFLSGSGEVSGVREVSGFPHMEIGAVIGLKC